MVVVEQKVLSLKWRRLFLSPSLAQRECGCSHILHSRKLPAFHSLFWVKAPRQPVAQKSWFREKKSPLLTYPTPQPTTDENKSRFFLCSVYVWEVFPLPDCLWFSSYYVMSCPLTFLGVETQQIMQNACGVRAARGPCHTEERSKKCAWVIL